MNEEYPMPSVKPVRIPTKGLPWYKRVVKAFKPRQWKLIEDYIAEIPFTKKMRVRALIPAPFIFDFASVPRPFWFILDPVGLLLVGASFHDFAYRYGGIFLEKKGEKGWVFIPITRLQADELFERITRDVNGMAVMARIARYAVNIGGWAAWKGNMQQVFVDYPRLVPA